jgi:ribonucleoside-diphosphate reductase alpha chain
VNNNTVDVYKDKQMKIHASNMCSEIMLPSSSDESFVCDLSSMNLLYYHEWKDTDAVETMIYFLDAVMTDFIEKLEDLRDSDNDDDQLSFTFMKKAHRFATRHRAL